MPDPDNHAAPGAAGRMRPLSAEVPEGLTKAISSSKPEPGGAAGGKGPGFQVVRELGKELEPPLGAPRAVAVRRDGWVFALDRPSPGEFRLAGFPPGGGRAAAPLALPRGRGDEELLDPAGLAFDAQHQVYVPDAALGAVKRFSPDGRWLGSFATAGPDGGRFAGPRDVAVDEAGNLLVADTNNNRVVQLGPDGELGWVLERFRAADSGSDDELYEPWSVCVAGGLIWVADTNNNRVLAFDAQQRRLRGALAAGGEAFVFPCGARPSRDGKAVHVADHGNLRVRRFDLRERGADHAATLTLAPRLDPGGASTVVAGGAAMDVDAAGRVVLAHPLRGSVVVLEYPGGP